ncbi:hypothetical protein FEM48_Zijuj06G0181800 [Ziziphus jujuba var. spinosa]|uniref:Retrovirus-related Pol polyprotein from transposon TNT 1-94-like beta-barrel domain-containing protein n=1 Tax=Ziziphus jujuba var. spinosa TaxID=714518 RepID=A0A978VAU5_ZIZJJ|nr:hypothetical protein FEM48_Zijuj06G0181800 [Ziziphus jujuba var. spinosa]
MSMYVLTVAVIQPVNFFHMKCDVLELKGDNYKAIDDQFVTSDKALASTLIMQFSSIKLTWIRGLHDHIMHMRDIAAQLKYGPFKISYNTYKDKWSINELLTMCVQEEGRLAMEEGEKVNLIVPGKKKNQAKQKGKNVNHNTWRINSGSSIYVTNSLQELHDLQKLVGSEQSIYSGNKMPSHVEAAGTCKLVLSSGFILSLEIIFYVPGFSRNLISVSRLVSVGY